MAEEISWREIAALLSPAGRDQLIDFVRRAREERGQAWLQELREQSPLFCWLADLCANYTGEQAFAELEKKWPRYPLWLARLPILDLHARLRAEIDKPR